MESSAMPMRRSFALVSCAAACASVLMFAIPAGVTTVGAPRPIDFVTGTDARSDTDAMMLALHRQASDAMASLQAATRDR
jgi:hypothetical protein